MTPRFWQVTSEMADAKNTMDWRSHEMLRKRILARLLLSGWFKSIKGIERSAQFDNLKDNKNAKDCLAQGRKYANELAANIIRSKGSLNGPSLILYGTSGSGKTWLCWAILFEILMILYRRCTPGDPRQPMLQANFFLYSELDYLVHAMIHDRKKFPLRVLPGLGFTGDGLFRDGTKEGATRREYKVVRHLREIDLLIIDDIAMVRSDERMLKLMHNVVTYRVEHRKPTIVTSNQNLEAAAAEGLIDLRVVFRLEQDAKVLNLRGVNWRKDPDGHHKPPVPAWDIGHEDDPDPYRDIAGERRAAEEAARVAAHEEKVREEERQYREGEPLFRKAARRNDMREWNRLCDIYPAIADQMRYRWEYWREQGRRRQEKMKAAINTPAEPNGDSD